MELAGQTNEKLESAQLAAIESQLHALLRQQAKRAIPVDLPRPDFWQVCSELLQAIEIELAEIGRSEGWSVRAQTLSRRQANLRHAIADLTRHRLSAFVNHAALSSLSSTPFSDATPDQKKSSPIDWQRHNGAERAFHSGVSELIDQYKQNISWDVLQQGILGSEIGQPMTPAGNAQLDAYVEGPGGITGQQPPKIETIQNEEIWEDPDFDEEDRIALIEGYPEIDDHVPVEIEIQVTPVVEHSDEEETTESEPQEMMRIRILQDSTEPIIDENGNEIELFEGDVHNWSSDFAETLIAAGLAENAEL
ncbi:MAG: hypothetical protein VX627_04640 [Candidatus Thermoplasmatota archaeon]|nr:hypothetical protein [Candidatus Thermoplasmatota archaeon]